MRWKDLADRPYCAQCEFFKTKVDEESLDKRAITGALLSIRRRIRIDKITGLAKIVNEAVLEAFGALEEEMPGVKTCTGKNEPATTHSECGLLTLRKRKVDVSLQSRAISLIKGS